MFTSAGRMQRAAKRGSSDPTVTFLMKANTGFQDQSASNTIWDVAQTATLSTDQAKFGTTSFKFIDATTRLESSNSKGLVLTDTGWTIEAWIYLNSTVASKTIIASQTAAVAGGPVVYIGGQKPILATNIARMSSTLNVAINGWHHVAYTKNAATDSTIWIDGSPQVLAGNFSGAFTLTTLAVGSRPSLQDLPFVGYIDSIRVSQQVRYTSAFTPAEFPNL